MTLELFGEHKARRQKLESLLNVMKAEIGKSPFDETVIDFLELMLEYFDKAPAL